MDDVSQLITYSCTENESAPDEVLASGSLAETLPIEERRFEDLDRNSRANEKILTNEKIDGTIYKTGSCAGNLKNVKFLVV